MNKRIRELAEQAEDKEVGYYFFDREKFAELIVKECSGILRTEAKSNWEGNEERLLNAMANWIEEHFGVEQ